LLEKYQGIERGKSARKLTDKAPDDRRIPESPYQRALLAVTDLITERDHKLTARERSALINDRVVR
jgi:hypothetical protein